MQLILSLLSAPALVLAVQAAPAADQQSANAAPATPDEAQAEAKSEAKQEAKPEKPTKICRTIRNTGMRTLARQ
ncbi:MAG: hypothetical protein A3J40_08415 [Erythrobacter sp. RIFCSPHIGHO2_12_FULL_63_10]|nr:MAG: hypothetical protein A3J40_08415 [Erythrobacter sp. RIFCSPHIGHO2_12_FULL_63_10]